MKLSTKSASLAKILEGKHELLGKMYYSALQVLHKNSITDRFALAAHNIRELIEKLPLYINFDIAIGQQKYDHNFNLGQEVYRLSEQWAEVVKDRDCYNNEWKGEIQLRLKTFLETTDNFINQFNQNRPRRNESLANALVKLDPIGVRLPNPLENLNITLWDELRDFFQAVSHHRKPVSGTEFLYKLSQLEDFLLDRLNPQTFSDFSSIDDLVQLGESNGVATGIVEDLIPLITIRFANYEYFFQQLSSADWIAPLAEKGFFQQPYDPIVDGNRVAYPVWPDSRYLNRVCSKQPNLVVEISRKIPPTKNVMVLADLLDIAIQVNIDLSKSLSKKINKSVRELTHIHFYLPDKIADLVSKYLRAGHGKAGLSLARALLYLIPNDRTREAQPKFDEWEFEQIIKKLMPELLTTNGLQALELLCDLLKSSLCIENYEEANDYSRSWRPAIEGQSSYTLKNILVTALCVFGDQYIAGSGDTYDFFDLLSTYSWPVYRRLEIYFLYTNSHHLPLLVAERLTDREYFDNWFCTNEYNLLLKKCFGSLQGSEKAIILGWIDEGPDIESLRTFHQYYHDTDPNEEELNRYVGLWTRDHLSQICFSLPTEWADRYRALVQLYGEPDSGESGNTLVLGPASPLSVEGVLGMSLVDLVEFLTTWRPSSNRHAWENVSYEGLGNVLSESVRKRPENFAEFANVFCGIRPSYIQAIVTGLDNCLSDGKEFPWGEVLNLCLWVASSDRSVLQTQNADHRQWGGTKRIIATLIGRSLYLGKLPSSFRESVWELLKWLAEDTTHELSTEDSYDQGFNPMAHGSICGEALEAIISFGLWQKDVVPKRDQQVWIDKVISIVSQLMKNDQTRAIGFVLGRNFIRLLSLDPKWAITHLSDIFPTDGGQEKRFEAAWGGFVIFNGPSTESFRLLSKFYDVATDRLQESHSSQRFVDRVTKRLGKHLLSLYLSGNLDIDSPDNMITHYFSRVSNKTIGEVMQFFGTALDGIPYEISTNHIERLKELWEWRKRTVSGESRLRQEELSVIGSWYLSGLFNEEWILEELAYVLGEIGDVKLNSLVFERISLSSERFPQLSTQCIRRFVNGITEGWKISNVIKSIEKILRNALHSEQVELRDEAIRIINILGARGFAELRTLLSEE